MFNVVRELMIDALGPERVVTGYADRLDRLPDPALWAGRHLIVKSHAGSAELDAWLAAERALVIVSVRDRRDAAVSMAQRFEAPLAHTARWLVDDCARLLRRPPDRAAPLRYEDWFFDDPATAEHVAYMLGLRPATSVIADVFARYRTDAVQAFAGTLATGRRSRSRWSAGSAWTRLPRSSARISATGAAASGGTCRRQRGWS